jgi:hypothetical protein
MEQLNEDSEYEVEQINERMARIDHCLGERSKKLEALVRESGKLDSQADEDMNELEHEKRDQDNR